jgi:hypothetical protein
VLAHGKPKLEGFFMDNFVIPEGFFPIKGFEDSYAISKNGEIMRIKKAHGARQGRILKNQFHSKRGYLIIRLTTKEKSKSFDVHVLMANTFLGRVDNKLQVCHNNGIKTDCRLENLRLDTVESNQMDRVIHGTSNRGTRNGQNKYPTNLILDIKNELKNGKSAVEIAKKFGVSASHVRNIKNLQRWVWL